MATGLHLIIGSVPLLAMSLLSEPELYQHIAQAGLPLSDVALLAYTSLFGGAVVRAGAPHSPAASVAPRFATPGRPPTLGRAHAALLTHCLLRLRTCVPFLQAYGVFYNAASRGNLVTLSSLTFLTPVRPDSSVPLQNPTDLRSAVACESAACREMWVNACAHLPCRGPSATTERTGTFFLFAPGSFSRR